jgi:hypothetical protein
LPNKTAPADTTRIGDSVRVVNGKTEWSPEDFANVFLSWLVMTDTNYCDGWVWFPDIRKHLLTGSGLTRDAGTSNPARWFAVWAA